MILTPYTDEEVAARAKALGFDSYLVTFESGDLFQEIEPQLFIDTEGELSPQKSEPPCLSLAS